MVFPRRQNNIKYQKCRTGRASGEGDLF
jgi:hypothetical protein